MKNEIDKFNNKIKEIMKQLNDLSDIIKIYYEINSNILNNYTKQNRNYQTLKNINDISINNEIFKELENINKLNNIKDEFSSIINL